MAGKKRRRRKFDVPDAKLRRLLGKFESAVRDEEEAVVVYVVGGRKWRGEKAVKESGVAVAKARAALCRHLTELLRGGGALVWAPPRAVQDELDGYE